MVKVFVAQTHDVERNAVCDFLKVAGYTPKPYDTRPDVGQLWLARDLTFLEDPAILVTSQRDAAGYYHMPLLLQTFLMQKSKPTLMVVYSRAAAYPQYFSQVVNDFLEMWKIRTPVHAIQIVPKTHDATSSREHDLILDHIRDFSVAHSIPMPQLGNNP